MMISAPDINQVIVAALHFVVMVGNIAHEIGKITVGFHQNAVLVVSIIGRTEERCALSLK